MSQGAIAQLCTAGTDVSAHYIVLEDGRIMQCVPEAKRAWHAGVASWAGEDDINSCSIGIEIVNRGHDWGYPDYPLRQIAAVIALCRGIMLRRKVPLASRARPFRRRAFAQEGPRRKISVAFAGQFRRRPLGAAGADRARRARSSSAPSATPSATCSRRSPNMATASRSPANTTPSTMEVVDRLPASFPPRPRRRRRRSFDAFDACRRCSPAFRPKQWRSRRGSLSIQPSLRGAQATEQSTLSFRVATNGLLRFARNDEGMPAGHRYFESSSANRRA